MHINVCVFVCECVCVWMHVCARVNACVCCSFKFVYLTAGWVWGNRRCRGLGKWREFTAMCEKQPRVMWFCEDDGMERTGLWCHYSALVGPDCQHRGESATFCFRFLRATGERYLSLCHCAAILSCVIRGTLRWSACLPMWKIFPHSSFNWRGHQYSTFPLLILFPRDIED